MKVSTEEKAIQTVNSANRRKHHKKINKKLSSSKFNVPLIKINDRTSKIQPTVAKFCYYLLKTIFLTKFLNIHSVIVLKNIFELLEAIRESSRRIGY